MFQSLQDKADFLEKFSKLLEKSNILRIDYIYTNEDGVEFIEESDDFEITSDDWDINLDILRDDKHFDGDDIFFSIKVQNSYVQNKINIRLNEASSIYQDEKGRIVYLEDESYNPCVFIPMTLTETTL